MRRAAKSTLAGTSLGTTPIAGLAITLHAGTINFSSFMREKKNQFPHAQQETLM